MTPNKQGKGVQPGSGIPNNTFFKLTLYQFSSVQFSSVLIREPGARPRIGMFPALVIIDCSVFFIVSVRTLYHGPLIYIYIYMYSFTTIIITHKYHYCLYIYIYIIYIHILSDLLGLGAACPGAHAEHLKTLTYTCRHNNVISYH